MRKQPDQAAKHGLLVLLPIRLVPVIIWAAVLALASSLPAQLVSIDTSPSGRRQTIDGFGACLSGNEGQQAWWQQLYFDDLGASMLRVDMTPSFRSPYSDYVYNSPWFGNNPPLPGPDANNVRTYTNAADYQRLFAGRRAPIAVMGPNIDTNIGCFTFPATPGAVARAGVMRRLQLGDFKIFGSLWSPAPWVKVSSGNTIQGQSGVLPVNGTPWPFIWGGNFAGGKLDVSGTPLADFDDSALGGTGPTSALTQFARGIAAYVCGFQRAYQVRFYSLSIQNELNFEEFYGSCTYPLSSEYLTALKAVRAEFDKYPDLAPIRLMGPEDLLGGDAYGMWQYGGGASPIHKNLQYLQNIAADPGALAALSFFCIHGYASDGVSTSGATPTQWNWWINGWTTSPAPGIPPSVNGVSAYAKKSWMTETSGESPDWLSPATGYPGLGAWSIALRIHQALTAGQECAWAYWQFTDGNAVGNYTLTDSTLRTGAAKYTAAKHFFRYLRPNSVRVATAVANAASLSASAYLDETNAALTVVLINASTNALAVQVQAPELPVGLSSFQSFTSDANALWVSNSVPIVSGLATLSVPGYGLCTLYGPVARQPVPPAITQLPQSTNLTSGGTARLTCAATGDPPLAYQWLFNNLPIPGANSTSLTLPDVQPYQAGQYAVQVTNSVGSINSFAATLTDTGSGTVTPITPTLSATESGGQVQITFQANPGRIYSWLVSTNLTSWSLLQSFVSGESLANYGLLPSAAAPVQYFRVTSP